MKSRSKKAVASQKPSRKPKNKNYARRAGLDQGAAAWAALLADPCNAPLAQPCYQAGSSGGQLVRLEADLSYTLDGTIIPTNFAVLFTPGLNSDGGGTVGNDDTALLVRTAATGDTSGNWAPVTNGPGFSTLQQYQSMRPVAACLQLTYGGTELNRGGFVSMGAVPAEITASSTFTVNQLAGCCPNNIRMPESHCEIKWRPGAADEFFQPPNFAENGFAGRNSLLMVIRGPPNNTTIRFRLVAVYEVIPAFNLGYVINLTTPSRSSASTVHQVLEYMDRLGNWAWSVGHTAHKAIDVATGLYRVAKAYGNTASYIGERVAPLLLGA